MNLKIISIIYACQIVMYINQVRFVDMYSAGILPVYGNLVLLGKEARGWSGFSGKYDSTKDKSILDTATREFMEETAGLMDESRIRQLSDGAPVFRSSTPKGYDFHMYVVTFSVDDYNAFTNDKFMTKKAGTANLFENEKSEIRWVATSELHKVRMSYFFYRDLKNILHMVHIK